MDSLPFLGLNGVHDREIRLFSIVFKGKIWKKSQKGVYLQCQKSQKGV